MESEPYLCVAVVGEPAGSKVLLSSNIPNQEVSVTKGDRLNVAANGWRRVDSLFGQAGCVCVKRNALDESAQVKIYRCLRSWSNHLQLVEDGCLPCVVQTHNDDFVFCRKVEEFRLTGSLCIFDSIKMTRWPTD